MSKIDWTDETLNFIGGCTKVSPACDNCYAEIMAGRLANMGKQNYFKVVHWKETEEPHEPLALGNWNGKIFYDEQVLYKPLSWKKPRRIFPVSMGDLFHEEVPDIYIDRLMAIIALTPRHTYQILTKRPQRMMEYFNRPQEELIRAWIQATYDLSITCEGDDVDFPASFVQNRCYGHTDKETTGWPLTNMQLGATIENQEQLIERGQALLMTNAAKLFFSIEPMLGPVDLSTYLQFVHPDNEGHGVEAVKGVDWVIVGGESGHKARPMHTAWVKDIRDQCIESNTPFFFKNWGEWKQVGVCGNDKDSKFYNHPKCERLNISGNQGYHGKDALYMMKVGKKKAGHLIDGKEWRQFP